MLLRILHIICSFLNFYHVVSAINQWFFGQNNLILLWVICFKCICSKTSIESVIKGWGLAIDCGHALVIGLAMECTLYHEGWFHFVLYTLQEVVFNPCLTKLFFSNTFNQGGCCNPSLDFQTEPPMKLILVSIGWDGPSLFIHTKMSTIGQGVT